MATFKLGLTGGIGSGKSTVATLFEKKGATIIDTDQIAHELTAPQGLAMSAIEKAFGKDFVTKEGALDRQKMRQKVFEDKNAKSQLESILHPMIREVADKRAKESTGAYVIFVIPLLVEKKVWQEKVDRILVVDCDEEDQISRVKKRNHFTREAVLAIMKTQASREMRLNAADDVIKNNTDLASLSEKVDELHAKYLQITQNMRQN